MACGTGRTGTVPVPRRPAKLTEEQSRCYIHKGPNHASAPSPRSTVFDRMSHRAIHTLLRICSRLSPTSRVIRVSRLQDRKFAMAVNGTTAPIKAIEEAKIDILSQTQEDVSRVQLR